MEKNYRNQIRERKEKKEIAERKAEELRNWGNQEKK